MSEPSILNSSAEPMSSRQLSREDQQYHLNASRGSETIPTWADQLYMEQEQIVH